MTCRPGDPCYSLLGRVVTGRNTAGYDVNTQPQTLGGGPARSDNIIYNGAYQTTFAGNPNSNPGGRPMGVPKTEEERMATHLARYGTTDLPARGTGLSNPGGRVGVPLTDEQRMATHYARYGTTDLPARGTGIRRLADENGLPWGAFLFGGILGFIFAAFVLTPSGRKVGAATGARAARRIRGR